MPGEVPQLRISGGGINEGRANLDSTSCAIHAESTTSVVLRPGSFFKWRGRPEGTTKLKTSCQTQSKFEGTFYATKGTDHPRGTAPGRAGQLVEETRARPRPASLAFRQMTRAST